MEGQGQRIGEEAAARRSRRRWPWRDSTTERGSREARASGRAAAAVREGCERRDGESQGEE